MSHPVFIEILNPDGSVKNRHRCNNLPIRLGRAYDNDVILDDHHTAPHHALIERNQLDELVITDQGSINGISLNNQREAYFVVDGNNAYRLGRTRIRIRAQDYVVAAEQADDTNHHWEGWLPALVAILIISLITLFTSWVGDLHEKNLSDYLQEIIGMLLVALAWSGIWALLGRLFTGHPRFGRQLFITSCTLLAFELWSWFSGITAYAFSWEPLVTFSSHPTVVIVTFALYFNLTTAGHKRPERLKSYLLALAIFSSAIILTSKYQSSKHFADELYMSNLYPPSLRLSKDQTPEDFMEKMASLQEQVDKQREDKPEKD
jgi:hypothetical protein